MQRSSRAGERFFGASARWLGAGERFFGADARWLRAVAMVVEGLGPAIQRWTEVTQRQATSVSRGGTVVGTAKPVHRRILSSSASGFPRAAPRCWYRELSSRAF